jgi:acetyl-CoA acyltransferase 1
MHGYSYEMCHASIPQCFPGGSPFQDLFRIVPDVGFSRRQCSSGLQAIASVAASIKAGYYTIGLAGGVETMSSNPMNWEGGINERIADFPKAQGCLMPMGVTSENVAAAFGVDRKTQDTFAMRSHKKAAAAQAAGKFRDEIVPVHTKVKDPKSGEEKQVVISQVSGCPGLCRVGARQLATVLHSHVRVCDRPCSRARAGSSLIHFASARRLFEGKPLLRQRRSVASRSCVTA